MNLQLLTINNITKICDDNYYFNPDNNLTEMQWYDHQINFIIPNIDVDIELNIIDSITGYRLSRNKIYNLLVKTFKTSNFRTKESVTIENLKKYGLFKPTNLPLNIYSYDNLGGLSQPPIEYNKSKKTISLPKKYIYGIIFGSDKKQDQRSLLGKQAITRSGDENEKLGKFEWYNNSCYADSILLPLIYNAIQNSEKLIYKQIMNFNYNEDNIKDIITCSNDKENSHIILNKSLEILRRYLNDIREGKIFSIFDLLKEMNKCTKVFSQNFSNGAMHDLNEFLKSIFLLLNFKIDDAQITKEYIASYDAKDKINISNINITNAAYKLILTDGLGQSLFEPPKVQETRPQIQSVNIKTNMLLDLYTKSEISTVSTLIVNRDPKKYHLDPLLKKYVHKNNILDNEIYFNNIEIDISQFIITREIHDLTNKLSYYYYSKDIEDTALSIDQTDRYYYNIKDKGKPSKYKKASQITPDIGFRKSYTIIEKILGNSSEYIVFNINRTYRSQIYTNRKMQPIKEFLSIKINPKEIISINGVNYRLTSIAMYKNLHYFSIILIGNEYYLYDDKFELPMTNYISKIGSHANLLNYTYKNVNNIALRHSKNLIYSKV